MRLVIDLQGAQGSSYARGIGRYSRELALAMAAAPRGHEVIIALNGAFAEPAAELAASFAEILPRSQIRAWHPPRDIAELLNTPLRRVAEMVRAQFLASFKPDLVHVTSLFEGFGDDVTSLQPLHLARLPVVATCYDLIPLIRHDDYFRATGPLSQGARWYYRCAHEMAMSEGLLAISESSRHEAIRHLSFDPEKIFDIQSGISADFHPAPLFGTERAAFLKRYGLRDPFILFLGAGDVRKNEAGLIAAFARLPPSLRDRHQLLIVGKMDPTELHETAKRLEVPADDFVIVPFVPESDLNALYSACTLFVFPSLHEGFGLPVAEAMACGAPVIASNTSSLPEVIGREDATFDPTDPDSISACMQKILENQVFRKELAQWGPIQAARFTWPSSAARAWDALESIEASRQHLAKPQPAPILQVRPSLAFVSPFPPQASGIADYSYELVMVLARHYAITLVTEAVIRDVRLSSSFPLLHPGEFLREAGRFDRVLYQIGNSEFHRFQIEDLLLQCPGIVVLHDAFLADYANWWAHIQGDPAKFTATLLHSHGYQALRYEASHGRDAARAKYPCNLSVLQAAVGVIQHSRHGKEILERFYGNEAARTVALVPFFRAARPRQDKAAARTLLGLEREVFLVCSFGSVLAAKCPDLIADAWRRTGLVGNLIFVGDCPADLAEQLTDTAAGIRCTGRVDANDYDLWLAAADVAVQWRIGSRGESSAAIADVLIAGLPLIFNRHGSAAEIPDNIGLGLPDEAGPDALANAILALHGNPTRRREVADAGRAFAVPAMASELAASRYFDAIEQAYATLLAVTAVPRFAPQVRAAASLPGGLEALSKSLSRSFPGPWRTGGNPRLLIDISGLAPLAQHPGSPRVLRELCRSVLESSPPPYRGTAIRVESGYVVETFAEPFALLGYAPLDIPETPLDVGTGDILICAGPNADLTDAGFSEFRRLQLEGARIILVITDLLPIHHPELFHAATGNLLAKWTTRMISIADGVVCTSNAVIGELMAWLDADRTLRHAALPIGSFTVGANFPVEITKDPLSLEEAQALENALLGPSLLMVGAIEPWEGHTQALDAFELLWGDGMELGLCIVGQPSQEMAGLAARLEASAGRGKRLHWLPACNDDVLTRLRRASAGLLIASTSGTGGLPIIEAAYADMPILARDLPVFRELAEDRACYFTGNSPEALALALRNWRRDGFVPRPTGIKLLSWAESYRRFCELILEDVWPKVWRRS